MIHFDNNNHGDSYSALTTISTTCFTVAIHVQIKSSVKMDSITLATEYVLIATIFKHMLLGNSHITLYTHRKPYSTPGTNTIMIGSVHARKHTPTHTHTYIHTHTHTYTHTHTCTPTQTQQLCTKIFVHFGAVTQAC